MDDIKALTNGKWPGIMQALGIDVGRSNEHKSCPICKDGKDRFRFDDHGVGSWYCNQCSPKHAGDGFDLVMKVLNIDFKTAVEEIKKVMGTAPMEKQQPEVKMTKELMRKIYLESRLVESGDPVSLYLRNRGLSVMSNKLRYHPAGYEPETHTKMPTMLATYALPDSTAITMHRTFLTSHGNKADIVNPKKVLPALQEMRGGAIRLFEPKDGLIAIAEGIETALAVTELTDIPCWSAVSAALLEGFEPPKGIKYVMIFSDNDKSFTGQKAAYALANRLTVQNKLTVEVHLPTQTGDWLDELNRKMGR